LGCRQERNYRCCCKQLDHKSESWHSENVAESDVEGSGREEGKKRKGKAAEKERMCEIYTSRFAQAFYESDNMQVCQELRKSSESLGRDIQNKQEIWQHSSSRQPRKLYLSLGRDVQESDMVIFFVKWTNNLTEIRLYRFLHLGHTVHLLGY